MTRLDKLKREALESCRLRGHDMGYFKTQIDYPKGTGRRQVAISYCKHCKMYVQVDSYPEPNGIDIGGNAVAINCGGTV